MKKSYEKLSTELIEVEMEEGPVCCSVRSENVTVQSYVDNTSWVDSNGNSFTSDTFEIDF